MGNARLVLRSRLIICIVGIVGIAISLVATAEDGDFQLVFATLSEVQTGSDVQSASGVIRTLYRLALEEGYTDIQADALMVAVAGLIASEIPPGTILQVSKQLLEDVTPDELLAKLAELEQRIADGESPGRVANDILGRGNGNGNAGGNGNEEDEDLDDEDEDLDDEDENLNDEDDDDNGNGNGNGNAGGNGNGNGNGNA